MAASLSKSEKARHAARRAAMHGACLSLRSWPEGLLTNAFIDGLCSLAVACDELEVADLALASLAADEDPGLSSVARALLAERALRKQIQGPTVDVERSSLSRPTAPTVDVKSTAPIDLEDFALAVGVRADALVRRANGRASAAATESSADGPAWLWPEAEAARRVVAPAMTFSASRLNTFAKCPRRWYFEYLCDAVPDEGSVHATYGKVFHEALEALHRDIRIPSQHDETEICERLRRELDAAFDKAHGEFANPLEYEVCRLKARAVAAHYARWLWKEAQVRPLEVRDVEIPQRWSHAGYVFVGYIDRIDRPLEGGPITIYDYKTGRIDDDPRVYLDRVRSGEEGQLALYWAFRQAQGEHVSRIALISVRDPRDPAWILALDIAPDEAVAQTPPLQDGVLRVSCSPADLDLSIAALVARCNALCVDGFEHFSAGEDPPCAFCAYASACRERPREKERIFAR